MFARSAAPRHARPRAPAVGSYNRAMSDTDDEAPVAEDTPAWRRNLPLIIGLVALAGLGAGAWYWLVGNDAPPPAAQGAAPTPPRTLPPSPPEPVAAQAPEPDAGPPPTVADLEPALVELVGAPRVQSLFRLQDLPRRVVTTIDNLGHAQASSTLWPVNPASGPFTTDRSGDEEVIARANAARYAPYVEMLEAVDLDQAVAAYRRFHPLLQQAYEDLGYPDRGFDQRLVEVIDVLLVTPEPRGAVRVRLPEFSAEVKPERPWVLYEFADPAFQELSAGQRVLLRMSADQRQRVKRVLTALRLKLVAGSASIKAPAESR